MQILSHPPIVWACVTCVVICVCRRGGGGREGAFPAYKFTFISAGCHVDNQMFSYADSLSQLIKLTHERRYPRGKDKQEE